MNEAKAFLSQWAKVARAYNKQTTKFFRGIVSNVGKMDERQKAELTSIIEDFICDNDDLVNRSLSSLDEIGSRMDVS